MHTLGHWVYFKKILKTVLHIIKTVSSWYNTKYQEDNLLFQKENQDIEDVQYLEVARIFSRKWETDMHLRYSSCILKDDIIYLACRIKRIYRYMPPYIIIFF